MQSGESQRLELGDLLALAELTLGRNASELHREIDIAAAESALAAPFAGVADRAFYPDPIDRAAICCSRLVRNHPLVDGNKRVAYVTLRYMLLAAGFDLQLPDRDKDEGAVAIERLAARDLSEADFAQWVRDQVTRAD